MIKTNPPQPDIPLILRMYSTYTQTATVPDSSFDDDTAEDTAGD